MRTFLRRTHAGPLAAIAAASTGVLLALQFGCGNVNRSTLAPLPSSPSATIAGSAHAQGGSALQGVVVTLEAIDGGVSASVQRAIREQGARRGASRSKHRRSAVQPSLRRAARRSRTPVAASRSPTYRPARIS